MKSMLLVLAALIASTVAATAQDYGEYPAPMPGHRLPRSRLTGHSVFIPPYRRPFPIRVYTTPPRQPYYNVPPYAVIAPY